MSYSVRSAYRNIIDRNQIVDHHGINGNWNQIWRGKAPPRIKNFLWRVAQGVNCTTQCPFCSDQEDNIHALFYCPKSTQCWQRLGLWNDIAVVVSNPSDIAPSLPEILA